MSKCTQYNVHGMGKLINICFQHSSQNMSTKERIYSVEDFATRSTKRLAKKFIITQ